MGYLSKTQMIYFWTVLSICLLTAIFFSLGHQIETEVATPVHQRSSFDQTLKKSEGDLRLAFSNYNTDVELDENERIISINLSGTKFSDSDLRHVQGISSLKHLDLCNTNIGDAGFMHLMEIANLESLDLANTATTDAGLKQIRSLDNLKSLNLFMCRNVTDGGLEHLTCLQNIVNLNLAGSKITNKTLKMLNEGKNIQRLYLDATGITDAGIDDIKKFSLLESLSLCQTRITDAGLAKLVGLEHLKELRLTSCKGLTDDGFKHFSQLKSLEILWIEHMDLSSQIFNYIDELPKLRELALNSDHISVAGIIDFWQIRSNLSIICQFGGFRKDAIFLYRGVRDKDLAHFNPIALADVKHMSFAGSNLGDPGLEHLKNLNNLLSLNLTLSRVTEKGVEKLKKNLTNCNIFY